MHATIRRAYRDSLWGQLHYRVAGTATGKPPLLCLHSAPSCGWQFEPVLVRMGPTRITFAPDLPGYGASDAPPSPVSITDCAAAMLELLDQLAAEGITPDGRVDVLGYQAGSAIAVEMARLRPSRIRRLTLVSLAAYSVAERTERLAQLAAQATPSDADAHLRAMWSRMQRTFDAGLSANWKLSSLAEHLRCGTRAYWGHESLLRYEFQRALDELIHEVLIVNPEDDLWHVTRENASRVRNSFYVDLTGIGHGLFELQPERMTALLVGFLDGRSTFSF